MKRPLAAALACLALLNMATPSLFAQGGATFEILHSAPSNCRPLDISADGNAVVIISSGAIHRWTQQFGLELVASGDVAGGGALDRAGISDDGEVVVGSLNGSAFRWTRSGGLQMLTGAPSLAKDANADGSVICGRIFSGDGFTAFRWTAATGTVPLGGSTEFGGGTARAISSDGTVLVGNVGGGFAASWIGTSGPVLASYDGTHWDISSDGSVVVGSVEEFPMRAALGGNASALSSDAGISLGTAADGSVVVGFVFLPVHPFNEAFIWDAAHGYRSLRSVLSSGGAAIPGNLELGTAFAISADATVVVGTALDIPNNVEVAFRATLPCSPLHFGPNQCQSDTDGDGLLDDWEKNGIPYIDSKGAQQRYKLRSADPMKANLYIEVDSLFLVSVPNLDPVAAAFANAPVLNPDGTTGIILTIDIDEDDLVSDFTWTLQADQGMPPEFDLLKTEHFGTPSERNDISAAELLAAKAQAYRYCIVAHEVVNASGGHVLGRARDYWSNDFLVAASVFIQGPGGVCQACDVQTWFRSTFMHELGHCLGLQHGGSDGLQAKPNYLSVMNYLRQLPFQLNTQTWRLDYSRGTMETLLEGSIDESNGMVDVTGFNDGFITYYSEQACNDPNPCSPVAVVPNVPIRSYKIGTGSKDFNGNGVMEQQACAELTYFGSATSVAGTQNPTPCQTLSDFDDWHNLILPVRPVSLSLGEPEIIEEITLEEVHAIMAELPQHCFADITPQLGDGQVNVNDLLAVINQWGPCPAMSPCSADIAPSAVDGVVNVNDLLAVINSWGPCSD